MFDLGGWHIGVYLMIVIDAAAVVLLGIAIAYGSRMWRDAPAAKEPDRATRRLYHPRNDESWGR